MALERGLPEDPPEQGSGGRAFPRPRDYWLMAGVILTVFVVSFGGRSVYLDSSEELRGRAGDQLLSIADLKVAGLADWSSRLVERVSFYGESPGVAEAFRDAQVSGDVLDPGSELAPWLGAVADESQFACIYALDAEGGIVGVRGRERLLDPDYIAAIVMDAPPGQVTVVDFQRTPEDVIHLSLVVPILDPDDGSSRIGSLVFVVDPSEFLYPFLQGWPTPSESGETLIIRRDGDDALFLNDLKFHDDAAVTLRVPIDRTDVPAVMAALGEEGIVEGVDYRGVEVIAAVRRVPNSPWFLVAKLDADEALAGLAPRLAQLVILTAAGVALVLLVAALFWRNARSKYYQRLYLSESRQRASRERFLLLAENLPAASYLCRDDEDWTMLYLNNMIEDITGYSRETFLSEGGVSYASLCDPRDLPGMRESIAGSRETGEAYQIDYRIKDASGEERWIEEFGQSIVEEGESLLLGVIFDITDRVRVGAELDAHRSRLEELVEERTRDLASLNEELDSTNEELQSTVAELEAANEELRELAEELEGANSAKSEFLASMSHELRTPLNSIIGFSGIVMSGMAGDVTAEQAHQIGMINSSGKALLSIINDILDLSKIEARKTELDISEFDASKVLEDVVETIGLLAEDKSVRVVLEDAPESLLVVSDQGRLKQILLNLGGNAVKFTEQGEVRLSVCKAGSEKVCFSVADTGPGIPRDRQSDVFEPFTQIRGSAGSKPAGTGLGLSISAEYAQLLGGTLEVSSELGAGAEFRLVLPARLEPRVRDSGR